MRRGTQLTGSLAIVVATLGAVAAIIWGIARLLRSGEDMEIVMPAGAALFLLALGLGASSLLKLAHANRRDTEAVLKEGIPGGARVLAVCVTNEAPVAIAVANLEIAAQGRQPYEASVEFLIDRRNPLAIAPGMTIAVRIDPDDARRIAIDWKATPPPDPAPVAAASTVIGRAANQRPHADSGKIVAESAPERRTLRS